MKKLPYIALALLALGACTQEDRALSKAPGTYESETEATDASGTTVKRKTTTDVSVDEYGNKRAVVKNKTSKDPKGLFNKTISSDTTIAVEK